MGLHAAIIRLSPLIHEAEQRYKPYIVGDPRMVTPPPPPFEKSWLRPWMWVKMYCRVDFLCYVFFFAEPVNKVPSSSTSLIVGLYLAVLVLVTCVVIGLLRYRRSRRAKEVNLSDIYMTYRCHTNVSKHYWWPYLKVIFTWACLAARLRRPWKLGIRIVMFQSTKHPCDESLGKINAKDVEPFRKEFYRLKALITF